MTLSLSLYIGLSLCVFMSPTYRSRALLLASSRAFRRLSLNSVLNTRLMSLETFICRLLKLTLWVVVQLVASRPFLVLPALTT